MKILVTGGAGFIGSHLVRELIRSGHSVSVLDNLDSQVHGPSMGANKKIPASLPPEVRFLRGDITEAGILKEALEGCEAVAHLAATVGVGQSMYEVAYYTHTNVTGTGLLYETIIKNKLGIKRIVVASSMSAYGEGMYHCLGCSKIMRGWPRKEPDLAKGVWDLTCPSCHKTLSPLPISEKEPFDCQSIYALTKRDTEEIALLLGKAHKIPTCAIRFFNVYGPGQSLSNPYTGVLAIFLSRVLNKKPPVVYEDGNQSRDFIHVEDLARAIRLTLESSLSNEIMNAGSGHAVSILEVAAMAINASGMSQSIVPQVQGFWRPGDIRHCFADISKIQKLLSWSPRVTFKEGVERLYHWAASQKAPQDRFDQATQELTNYGLLRREVSQ